MFREGHIYWAYKADARPHMSGTTYRLRIECIKRTSNTVTFRASDRNARLMGTKQVFTKKVQRMGIVEDGAERESVPRVSAKWPGSDWWIADDETRAARVKQ